MVLLICRKDVISAIEKKAPVYYLVLIMIINEGLLLCNLPLTFLLPRLFPGDLVGLRARKDSFALINPVVWLYHSGSILEEGKAGPNFNPNDMTLSDCFTEERKGFCFVFLGWKVYSWINTIKCQPKKNFPIQIHSLYQASWRDGAFVHQPFLFLSVCR